MESIGDYSTISSPAAVSFKINLGHRVSHLTKELLRNFLHSCNLNYIDYLIQGQINQYKCSSNLDIDCELFFPQPLPKRVIKATVSGRKSNS